MSINNTGYWYCPECREEVGGYNVTYQELHDACGRAVIWKDPIKDYETPEQYKERTGEDWPDNNAIYFFNGASAWIPSLYESYQQLIKHLRPYKKDFGIYWKNDKQYPCICATEAGCPPNDWKPENAKEKSNA